MEKNYSVNVFNRSGFSQKIIAEGKVIMVDPMKEVKVKCSENEFNFMRINKCLIFSNLQEDGFRGDKVNLKKANEVNDEKEAGDKIKLEDIIIKDNKFYVKGIEKVNLDTKEKRVKFIMKTFNIEDEKNVNLEDFIFKD